MRRIILAVSLIFTSLVLASCGDNPPVTPGATHTGSNYPTSQENTPATQYCQAQGGVVSVENNGTMDVAYCTINGEKKDAWGYMNEANTATGEDVATQSGVVSNTTHYTLDQVAVHNTPADCWTVVDGVVYNVTSFFGQHPGGDENLGKLCGVEGTELFRAQHAGNPKANEKIKTFEIGTLVL